VVERGEDSKEVRKIGKKCGRRKDTVSQGELEGASRVVRGAAFAAVRLRCCSAALRKRHKMK
jgi:hypothetical protein